MTREEAIEQLKVYRACMSVDGADVEAYNMAIKALEQEPKTGHWIDKFAGVYRCSCCRETIEIDTEIDYPNGITFNYCPNCGAKMESEVIA